MELVKILSSVIKENRNSRMNLTEISNTLMNQLLTKFRDETEDSEDDIKTYINDFGKYQNGLPADKRDLTKYTYEELKSLIKSKTIKKEEKDIFKRYMQGPGKGSDQRQVKSMIKRFLEIRDLLPEPNRDVMKYPYLKLVEVIQRSFGALITKAAFEKYKRERTDLTNEQILSYIERYVDLYDRLEANTPPILMMSFDRLESALDHLPDGDDVPQKKGDDFKDIETIYDKDNLYIFKPNGKEQCIRLSHGRPWCTSRVGGGNLYYNYRLENNLTLYYVIDKDKPFDDLDFAVVILVDEYGRKRIADGKNMSGGYSGHKTESWSTISSKVPKLSDKEYLFTPDPLTNDEKSLLRKYKHIDVRTDAVQELGSVRDAEFWLEISSPNLTNKPQVYINLPSELKKKYISLGMDLTGEMISNSEPDVVKYYLARKIDSLKTKSLGQLTTADIALINMPGLKNLKEELKVKYAGQLTTGGESIVNISYPNDDSSKYIALFGFDELFENLSDNISYLTIVNKSNDSLDLDIPETISKFQNLVALVLENCVKTIPEELGQCENLMFLTLQKNRNLESLPDSLADLELLELISLSDSNPSIRIPERLKAIMVDEGNGFYAINKD
jgi:DNA-binding protein H-NS